MEDPCAQTLEALEEFIQTQRNLLARTQSDIGRLRVLKHDIVDDPEDFITHVSRKLDSPAFRLSEQDDWGLSFPKKIQWGAFIGHDLSPLQQLHNRLRDANTCRGHPSKTSELSDLQQLVRNARKQIIDPVLIQFPPLSESEPESDEEIDPEVLRRQREHEKIRELKKMKIRTCGLKLPSRATATTGVFIRHDVDDESMEVDISVVQAEVAESDFIMTADLDEGSPCKTIKTAPAGRARRSTRNGPPSSSISDISRPLKRAKIEIDDKPRRPSPPSAVASKPKPETYKQAWSVSEQHLLEQLLDEIPEGEKFRWQKISRAMSGKRTPRQVASRVQKYFEKLKRFGVG